MTVSFNSYYITDDHEPIISRETWDQAQALIDQTGDDILRGVHRNCAEPHSLYDRLFCSECGAPYTRRTLTNRDGSHYKAWNCRERQKGQKGNGCKSIVIKENELLQSIASRMGMAQFDENAFLSTVERVMVSERGIEVKMKKAS